MTQFDLAIRGGTIVTASDEFRADIGIRQGRIVSIAERIEGASREIDATGLLALPGGIDSHVHISQESGPDVVMADDFASATCAARTAPSESTAGTGASTSVMSTGTAAAEARYVLARTVAIRASGGGVRRCASGRAGPGL